MLTRAFSRIASNFMTKEELVKRLCHDISSSGGKLDSGLQEKLLRFEATEIADIVNNCDDLSVVTTQSLKRTLQKAGIVDELLQLAGEKRGGERRFIALEALGKLRIDSAADVMLKALAEKNELLQLAAAGALMNLNTRPLIPQLLDDLNIGNWPVAHTGKILLKHPELVLKPLEKMVHNQDQGVIRAIEILSHIQSPRAVEALVHCLKSNREEVRIKAVMGLMEERAGKLDGATLESVKEFVGHEKQGSRVKKIACNCGIIDVE